MPSVSGVHPPPTPPTGVDPFLAPRSIHPPPPTPKQVDADWMSSRFRREDALLHALCERDETDPSGELG